MKYFEGIVAVHITLGFDLFSQSKNVWMNNYLILKKFPSKYGNRCIVKIRSSFKTTEQWSIDMFNRRLSNNSKSPYDQSLSLA